MEHETVAAVPASTVRPYANIATVNATGVTDVTDETDVVCTTIGTITDSERRAA